MASCRRVLDSLDNFLNRFDAIGDCSQQEGVIRTCHHESSIVVLLRKLLHKVETSATFKLAFSRSHANLLQPAKADREQPPINRDLLRGSSYPIESILDPPIAHIPRDAHAGINIRLHLRLSGSL